MKRVCYIVQYFLQNDLCHPDGIVKYLSFLANTIAHAGEN